MKIDVLQNVFKSHYHEKKNILSLKAWSINKARLEIPQRPQGPWKWKGKAVGQNKNLLSIWICLIGAFISYFAIILPWEYTFGVFIWTVIGC